MADITCPCGEPWDSYGVRHGDMSPGEAKRFLRGEGCPSCKFGTACPSCSGKGEVPVCSLCHGEDVLRAVQHPSRGWERPGYGGLTPCDPPTTTTSLCIGGWGTCQTGDVPCPCGGLGTEPCSACAGTGKPPSPDPDRLARHRAVHDALAFDKDAMIAELEDLP